jgi:hypothetical protein
MENLNEKLAPKKLKNATSENAIYWKNMENFQYSIKLFRKLLEKIVEKVLKKSVVIEASSKSVFNWKSFK